MISADTSVIVRYLVGTPAAQARRAAALVDGSSQVGIPLVAVVETAHVLRTQYDVDRADVIGVLIDLLARENVVLLNLPKPEAITALVRARALPGSPIPDALIAATARWTGALPLYSFDQELHRHGVAVQEP